LLIKYIKSVLWRVAKCLSYIEETRCLKVNMDNQERPKSQTLQLLNGETRVCIWLRMGHFISNIH